jgi:hypothetical protein
VAELREQQKFAEVSAEWHRGVLPDRPTQWGPATLQAVKTIVDKAEPLLKEGENKDWWNASAEAARWYAGLLCMETGLLPKSDPKAQSHVADLVRKRLTRGDTLRQTYEYYPMPIEAWKSLSRMFKFTI